MLYNVVQLLYNYVYCDLPYVHIKRFKCIMSLVLHTCTCTGSGSASTSPMLFSDLAMSGCGLSPCTSRSIASDSSYFDRAPASGDRDSDQDGQHFLKFSVEI